VDKVARSPADRISLKCRRRIEFCGSIGAGKSTVARLLSGHLNAVYVAERYRQIPFWEEFYQEPAEYAFEKNLCFLMFHSDFIRRGERSCDSLLVCDFSLFQDLSYARINGDAGSYDATVAVYDELVAKRGEPDLIINVTCPIAQQLARIRFRGREAEVGLTAEYIEALNQAIGEEKTLRLPHVPTIIIDTAEFDFVGNPEEGVDALLNRLKPWPWSTCAL
jgi:deoxyguanosine kinase